jgi:hypothetical protein
MPPLGWGWDKEPGDGTPLPASHHSGVNCVAAAEFLNCDMAEKLFVKMVRR